MKITPGQGLARRKFIRKDLEERRIPQQSECVTDTTKSSTEPSGCSEAVWSFKMDPS